MTEKPEWKNCPECKGFIPKTWQRHGKCGWNVAVNMEANTRKGDDILGNLMRESVSAVCSIFDMSLAEMKDALKGQSGFAQIIDTLFMAKDDSR